jgi:hypothetical protein
LCYSSTLYETLKPSYYPWPNLGPGSVAGIFSPSVVIFKHDLDNDCKDLPKNKRAVVSVITVAAPRVPDLTADKLAFERASDLEDLRGKIRLVYRMAARNGKTSLVLGGSSRGLQCLKSLSLIYEQVQWDAGHIGVQLGSLLKR